MRLTLAGLEQPNTGATKPRDIPTSAPATRRSSAGTKRCPTATARSSSTASNWRAFNNRAAVFVGLKQFDLAMNDVNAGLELAPQSAASCTRASK